MRHRNKEKEAAYAKIYQAKNRDKIKTYRIAYYNKNREKQLAHNREWRKNNPRDRSEVNRKWRQNNPGYKSPSHDEWMRKNPDKIKSYSQKHYAAIKSDPVRMEKRRAYQRSPEFREKVRARESDRRKNDPKFLIRGRLRARMKLALNGISKSQKSNELIGCSYLDLRAHIESLFLPGMTWENRSLWHIDHIRPCAAFNLLDADQQRQCFNYKNLQPLWALDNIRKSDSI